MSSLSITASAATKKDILKVVKMVNKCTLTNQDLLKYIENINENKKLTKKISKEIKKCSKQYNMALNTKDQFDNLTEGIEKKKKIKNSGKILDCGEDVLGAQTKLGKIFWNLLEKDMGINFKTTKLNKEEKKILGTEKDKEFIIDLKKAYDKLAVLISKFVKSLKD